MIAKMKSNKKTLLNHKSIIFEELLCARNHSKNFLYISLLVLL